MSHLAFATSQQWLVRFLLDVVAVKRIGHLDLVNKTCTKVGARRKVTENVLNT